MEAFDFYLMLSGPLRLYFNLHICKVGTHKKVGTQNEALIWEVHVLHEYNRITAEPKELMKIIKWKYIY